MKSPALVDEFNDVTLGHEYKLHGVTLVEADYRGKPKMVVMVDAYEGDLLSPQDALKLSCVLASWGFQHDAELEQIEALFEEDDDE